MIAIDNLITGNIANIEHLAGNQDFKFIHHDVTDFIYLPGKVDYVWHFASPASPIDYLELPIPTLKVGSLGTHNALASPRAKAPHSSWLRPPSAMAIRSSTRTKPRITGVT